MEGVAECAEEILGMPVRLGFPIGLEGIYQLVQGPQFSTGVGLLRQGGHSLADSHAREPVLGRVSTETVVDPAERGNGGFWNWFRAAF